MTSEEQPPQQTKPEPKPQARPEAPQISKPELPHRVLTREGKPDLPKKG